MAVSSLIEISLIMLVATIFRTAFGFGEALIAVPLLSLLLPVKVSAPLAVLTSILIALVVVIKDWKHIHFSAAKNLLISTLFGLPLGLLILRFLPEGVVKGLLAILLFGFSLFSLFKPDFFHLKDDRWAWLFGFLAGITGGSYGMNGPPLAIFGVARKWPPHRFRATIQAYFLPSSLLGMMGYYFSGLWTQEINILFLSVLPAIVVGIVIGLFLNRVIDQKNNFIKYLHVGLIVIASILLFQVAI